MNGNIIMKMDQFNKREILIETNLTDYGNGGIKMDKKEEKKNIQMGEKMV